MQDITIWIWFPLIIPFYESGHTGRKRYAIYKLEECFPDPNTKFNAATDYGALVIDKAAGIAGNCFPFVL